MIHTMPDKTVRVTSRYPKGHGTVYFDLAKANGFTLEEDCYYPETLVLRAVGCYNDFTARYGEPSEAEADFADLNLMLADRHVRPTASSVPVLASTQPPIALGQARRKGWGWKGMMAGLALGALGPVVATRTLTTDVATDETALRAAAMARARASAADDSLSQGAAWPAVPSSVPPAGRPVLPGPSAAQQPAPAAALAAAPHPQSPAPTQPRAAAPNFGLQP